MRQAGHKRDLPGASGSDYCAQGLQTMSPWTSKTAAVRTLWLVGTVELDLAAIDASHFCCLRINVDYEFRTTAVAELRRYLVSKPCRPGCELPDDISSKSL